MPDASSQSRGSVPKVSTFSAGRALNGRRRADRVDAAEEAADPFQHLLVLQFGRAAAAAGVTPRSGSRRYSCRVVPPSSQRRHHGNLALRQFERERVLFQDLGVRSSACGR